MHGLKNILKTLKTQGVELQNVCRSHFHYLCLDQTLNFPYFVAWCASNYSQSKRVIMDSNQSKILCPINSLVVRDALEVPQSFSQNLEDFVEETVIELYMHATTKEKQAFLSKILKPEVFC